MVSWVVSQSGKNVLKQKIFPGSVKVRVLVTYYKRLIETLPMSIAILVFMMKLEKCISVGKNTFSSYSKIS